MTTFSVVDCDGRMVSVGDTIRVLGEARVARVVEITEPDSDYDDELQRGVMYPPKIVAAYDGAGAAVELRTHDVTPVSWADYPDGPDALTFESDEVSRTP